MDARPYKRLATTFMLRAVQDWGQSDADRSVAIQALIDAAGFSASIGGGDLTGPDADAARAWLTDLLETMPRGKVEREIEHIEQKVAERAAQTGTAS